MSEKKFAENELILVDVENKVGQERWEPGLYLYELPNGNHLVEVMEGGRRTRRAYGALCLRHADQAYNLKVKYEVYVDTNWGGSDVLDYDGIDAEEEALKDAKKWSTETKSGNDVVVDRVVVGGCHPYAIYKNGERSK